MLRNGGVGGRGKGVTEVRRRMVVMMMMTTTLTAAKNQGQKYRTRPAGDAFGIRQPSVRLPEGHLWGHSRGQVRQGVSAMTPVAKAMGRRQEKCVGKEVQVEKSGAKIWEGAEGQKYLRKLCNIRAWALACPGFTYWLHHLQVVWLWASHLFFQAVSSSVK